MADRFEGVTGVRAAVRALPGRGLVRASGADRVRFLNGMLTADVAKLAAGETAPALQLDRKGHVQAELVLLADPDVVWLDVAPGCESELVRTLEKHVIADDVAFASLSGDVVALAVEGPGAADAVRAAGGAVPAAGRFERSELAGAAVLWLSEGAQLAEPIAEVLRIDAAIPALGRDVSVRNFPQEARLERAVSFKKGCYVGQEIVARIASRGAVNRVLVKLRTEARVEPGSEVSLDGAAIGQVTSAAESAATGAIALAYLKVEHAAPGQRVVVSGVAGEVAGGDTRR